jgi:hypothetical protein
MEKIKIFTKIYFGSQHRKSLDLNKFKKFKTHKMAEADLVLFSTKKFLEFVVE